MNLKVGGGHPSFQNALDSRSTVMATTTLQNFAFALFWSPLIKSQQLVLHYPGTCAFIQVLSFNAGERPIGFTSEYAAD